MSGTDPRVKRLEHLQRNLQGMGLEAALLWYSRDLFYYTGMVQPAWLALTPDDYCLFVRAGTERALADTFLPLHKVEPRRDLSAAFSFLDASGAGPRTGTEMDLTPGAWLERWSRRHRRDFVDITPAVLKQRMIKGPDELAALRKAQACVDAGHRRVLERLRPGISELELSAEVEDAHRRAGHEGTFFMRAPDFFMGRGLLASGPNLLKSTGLAFSLTGVGLSPSVPAGASLRRLSAGDLVLVDLPVLVEGYHVDHTRTYLLGPKTRKHREREAVLRELFDRAAEVMRPGRTWGQCVEDVSLLAQQRGVAPYFQRMARGPALHYIGHGVGIELNEPPLITRKNADPVEAGTVVAVEMHLLDPDGLVIKLEDMLHVGPEQSEYISVTPRELFSVG